MSQQYGGDTATVTTPTNNPTATQSYEEAREAAGRAMNTIAITPERQPVAAAPGVTGGQGFLRTPPDTDVDAELLSYRGFKFGAAFFGWLIAIAMTVLLLGAAAAAALGTAQILDYTTSDAKAEPAAAAITAAAVTVFMIMLAFYTGGYVAGRLARFDGGRQGFGVWMIALLVGAIAGGAVWFLDHQNGVLDDINRPDVALSNNTLMLGGIAAGAALLFVTLLAAIVGGKAGRRYHDKIDDLLD